MFLHLISLISHPTERIQKITEIWMCNEKRKLDARWRGEWDENLLVNAATYPMMMNRIAITAIGDILNLNECVREMRCVD